MKYLPLLLLSVLFFACDTPKKVVEETGGMPNKIECVDTTDPFSVAWMKKAMTEHSPYTVVKYRFRKDGWAYQFTGGNRHLYDCQGNLICIAKGKSLDDCARQIKDLNDAETGKVIYQRKENQD